MNNVILSNRLIKERKKTFWQSGVFRKGNIHDRMSWILQRSNEQYDKPQVNPFRGDRMFIIMVFNKKYGEMEIDVADSEKEAVYLVANYAMAFGNSWLVWYNKRK